MLKQEFERLAMKNDAEISDTIFATINRFYMCENNYHEENGGTEETKSEFVKRVFGGKKNTEKTIALLMAAERIRENDYCVGEFHRGEGDNHNHEMCDVLIEQTCAEVADFNVVETRALQEFVIKHLTHVTYVKSGKKTEFVYIPYKRRM